MSDAGRFGGGEGGICKAKDCEAVYRPSHSVVGCIRPIMRSTTDIFSHRR